VAVGQRLNLWQWGVLNAELPVVALALQQLGGGLAGFSWRHPLSRFRPFSGFRYFRSNLPPSPGFGGLLTLRSVPGGSGGGTGTFPLYPGTGGPGGFRGGDP
jgi:hypothetical protein